MGKKYRKSKVIVEVGGSGMLDGVRPTDGTEPLRSFADGTGRRKYAKNDPAVARMKAHRAKSYQKYGIGVTTSSNSVMANLSSAPVISPISNFKAGRKKELVITNIHTLIDAKSVLAKVFDEKIEESLFENSNEEIVYIGRNQYKIAVEPVSEKYALHIKRTVTVKRVKQEKSLLATIRHMRRKKMNIKNKHPKSQKFVHENKIKGLEALKDQDTKK